MPKNGVFTRLGTGRTRPRAQEGALHKTVTLFFSPPTESAFTAASLVLKLVAREELARRLMHRPVERSLAL